jgi:hypothetical protein
MIIYFITNVGRFKKDNGDIDYKNCVILYTLLVAYISQLNDFERKYFKNMS